MALNPRQRANIRAAVYARDGHKCVYCTATVMLTLDHDVPESLGGKSNIDNLRTCCYSCNRRKGQMTGWQFRAWLARHPKFIEANRRARRRRGWHDTVATRDEKRAALEAVK